MCEKCIQAFFNANRLWEIIIAEGYQCCIRKIGKKEGKRVPPGSRYITLECYHPERPERVIFGFWWHAGLCEVVGTKKMDPKNIIIRGFHFHRFVEKGQRESN